MTEAVVRFAPDHPCGAGHFPGNPIIPGALLLDTVLGEIGRQLGCAGQVWDVKSAKFPQPVRPGDAVAISYTQTPGGDVRFECSVSGNKVMSGVAASHLPDTDGRKP